MADSGGCSNVYALFAAPWMHQLKEWSAVTVFICSLTESNHVLILAVSPLYFSQSHKTVFYFEPILSSEFKWNKYHTPWSPILAHTKVSVYLTGFRNSQFRSITINIEEIYQLKSCSWGKNNFIPPWVSTTNSILWFRLLNSSYVY